MPLSTAALAAALHLIVDAKKELADLGGLLRLSLGNGPARALRVPTATMDHVPGLDGIWWLQMPCAHPEGPECTRLIVGGIIGAICPLAQVPHGVRLHLLEGALMWWQESQGRDAEGERIYRRYEKHDSWELVADEPHGFVATTDFIAYNTFSPYFTD